MRIAVFHNLPSGGAKRTLREQIRGLTRRGHEAEVFTLSSAEHDFADLRPHARSHRVLPFRPMPRLASPLGRLNQALRIVDLWRLRRIHRTLARAVERTACDMVLVHPCRYENCPSLVAELRRLPVVFYCHEPLRAVYEDAPRRPYDAEHLRRRRVLDRIDPLPRACRGALQHRDRRNVRRAGRVLVNSEFTRENVRRAYGVEARVSYPGVDTQWFRPLGTTRDRILLSVGSLTPLKGFDFLIAAVSRIRQDRRPPLVVAANFENAPERRFLERLAAESNVDARFLTGIDEESLLEQYNRAAMLVYAPVREPFGLVPLEAMACELPVVAVREGGVSESVLHERTGLLVEREPDRFAEAIQSLLDDQARASEYGRNGRRYVEDHWTWERAVEALEGYMRDFLQQHARVAVGHSRALATGLRD